MDVGLRAASKDDFLFARNVYFETMGWIIEQLFGWDQAREEESFARFFKLEDVSIITSDGQDVGWIQLETHVSEINIDSFYIVPAMQRQGTGSRILEMVLVQARNQSKAITLAVVKINPARRLYERHGFRITHQDERKFYMRANPSSV